MADTRRRWSPEFKRDAVNLVRSSGRPVAEIHWSKFASTTVVCSSKPATSTLSTIIVHHRTGLRAQPRKRIGKLPDRPVAVSLEQPRRQTVTGKHRIPDHTLIARRATGTSGRRQHSHQTGVLPLNRRHVPLRLPQGRPTRHERLQHRRFGFTEPLNRLA